MKALVTGGTGFSGQALVRRLCETGWEVTALDYRPGRFDDELRGLGARVTIASVTDAEAVSAATRGADVVFHLAAAFRQLNVPDAHYHAVNVDGTRNVLAAAAEHGVAKVVYCSTCGVHGNIAAPPAGEDAPITPADYYQKTKYLGELEVMSYARQGLRTVILRPAAIYGPGDPERFLMIFRRVARGRFPMFGDGRTFYHPLYVDNLTDAFVLAAQPGVGDGGTYLIADQDYVPIKTLVRKVAEALGVKVSIPHFPVWPLVAAGHACEAVCRPFGVTPPLFPRRVDWFRQNRAFRIDRAQAELGYRPAIGLDEGLTRTGHWYRKEGFV